MRPRSPPIVLIVEPRVVNNKWPCNSISLKRMFCSCLFLNPHLITNHPCICVWLRKVTKSYQLSSTYWGVHGTIIHSSLIKIDSLSKPSRILAGIVHCSLFSDLVRCYVKTIIVGHLHFKFRLEWRQYSNIIVFMQASIGPGFVPTNPNWSMLSSFLLGPHNKIPYPSGPT